MSTRSAIGYIQRNGNIRAVYCHFDGYLSNNGRLLIENYDLDGVKAICNLGDMSSLGETIEKCEFYGRDRHESSVQARQCESIDDYISTFSDCDYFYLLDDKKWFVITNNRSVNSLEEQLVRKNIDFTMYKGPAVKPESSALEQILELVNEGEVEYMTMIKLLFEQLDETTANSLVEKLKGENHD